MNESVIHAFGHPTVLDENYIERYADTGEPVTYPSRRPCPQCHRLPTSDGADPCLGHIEGAISACCGHGVTDGFIMWQPSAYTIFECDIPRWLYWLLTATGRGTMVTDLSPARVVLRYTYQNRK